MDSLTHASTASQRGSAPKSWPSFAAGSVKRQTVFNPQEQPFDDNTCAICGTSINVAFAIEGDPEFEGFCSVACWNDYEDRQPPEEE